MRRPKIFCIFLNLIFYSLYVVFTQSPKNKYPESTDKFPKNPKIEDPKSTKKVLYQRCVRQFVGSECEPGLECSPKFQICLRKNNNLCYTNKECLSGKCVRKRCKS